MTETQSFRISLQYQEGCSPKTCLKSSQGYITAIADYALHMLVSKCMFGCGSSEGNPGERHINFQFHPFSLARVDYFVILSDHDMNDGWKAQLK